MLVGGTGAMGMYLVPFLLDQKYEVFVTSRRERKSNHESLHYLKGNGHDIDWLESLSKQYNFDFVIDFMVYRYSDFEKKHNRLLDLGKLYIFISSSRVFANEDQLITEESPRKLDVLSKYPYFSGDVYALTKAREENLLRNNSKSNYVILRPYMSFSKQRFQYGVADNFDVIRALRNGKSAMSESMLALPTTLTYGKDVARMIANLLKNDAIRGQEINVVSSESYTWLEISDIYHKVFGLEMQPVSDAQYMVLTGQWSTMLDRFLPRVFDNSKMLALSELNQNDFYTLESGLEEAFSESNLDYYLKSNTNWMTHAKYDYFLGGSLNLSGVSEKGKEAYKEASEYFKENRALFENGVVSVSIKNKLWRVRTVPWDSQIDLLRTNKHTFGKPQKNENRWISLELEEAMLKGEEYELSFDYLFDSNKVIVPFLHNNSVTQIIGEMRPTDGTWKSLRIKVIPKENYLRFLTFSSTDIPVSGKVLSIKNVEVRRCHK